MGHRNVIRPAAARLGLVALLTLVAFMLMASETQVGTTEAAIDGAAMRLTVNGEPGKVSVFAGETFTVRIEIDAIPLTNGYTAVKAWVHYGDELGDQSANGAVKTMPTVIWPDLLACTFNTTITDQSGDTRLDSIKICGKTGLSAPLPASHYKGTLFAFDLTCLESPSSHFLELIPLGQAPANEFGTQITEATLEANILTPSVQSIDVNCVEKLAKPGDTDGDGCPDVHENRPKSEANRGGGRDWENPNDYFDVYGPGQSLTLDGVIDLPNDILGVIQHFAPLGTEPQYDVRFDRGPQVGANLWQLGPPDGVTDLPNDILGVINQFAHNCV